MFGRFKTLFITVLIIGSSMLALDELMAAGAPGPPGGGGGPPCWPAPCVPIDGGISFLIAAGLAYGGKKAYSSFKAKE